LTAIIADQEKVNTPVRTMRAMRESRERDLKKESPWK